jgi:hypothetical protein
MSSVKYDKGVLNKINNAILGLGIAMLTSILILAAGEYTFER